MLSVGFRSDGKIIASGSSDKTVILWDIEKTVEIRKLKDDMCKIFKVIFTHNG